MGRSDRSLMVKRTVLVTGAGSGIGRACALAFAREGVALVLADLDETSAIQTARMCEVIGSESLFVRCDVSRASDVGNLLARAVERFGRIDAAVNNAGIEGPRADTASCLEADWNRVIDVNLKGVWLCMKQEIPIMAKQGGGVIINCSSIAGSVGFPEAPAYSASKHGVIGLTQTAALEFARSNIRVNAVCPGAIQTPMLDRYVNGDERVRKKMQESEPLGRLGNPSEVADAVAWLASERASFVTGIALPVDGGWLAQ